MLLVLPVRLLTVLVAAAALLLAGTAPATALTSQEAREADVVAAVNAERARARLAPLAVSPALTALARQQAAAMSARGRLAHSTGLGRTIHGWRAWSENVGYGGSPVHVHSLLMASRPHRDNILSPGSRLLGVGVATDGAGRVWVTQIFVQPR